MACAHLPQVTCPECEPYYRNRLPHGYTYTTTTMSTATKDMSHYVTDMDIVDRLRNLPDAVSQVAADEIVRLRAENTKLHLQIRIRERDGK